MSNTPRSRRSRKPQTSPQAPAVLPITEQRFRTSFKWYDPSYKTSLELDVVVMTAAEWLEFPERAHCAWGVQSLGNGMVIAARLKPEDASLRDVNRSGDSIEGVEEIAVLRHFRSRFLSFLEKDPSLYRVELTTGGDARCEFRIDFEGHDPAVVVDVYAAER